RKIPAASTAHAEKLITILVLISSALIEWNSAEVHWINREYTNVSRSCTACCFPIFFSTAISQINRQPFTIKLNTAYPMDGNIFVSAREMVQLGATPSAAFRKRFDPSDMTRSPHI